MKDEVRRLTLCYYRILYVFSKKVLIISDAVTMVSSYLIIYLLYLIVLPLYVLYNTSILHSNVVALLLYTTVLYCTLMRYTTIVRTVRTIGEQPEQ